MDIPEIIKLVSMDKVTGCWNWTGSKRQGYGAASFLGKSMPAHRLFYALLVGPIPDGMQVLHQCDNRSCVNPKHLMVGTQLQNMQDYSLKFINGCVKPRRPREKYYK